MAERHGRAMKIQVYIPDVVYDRLKTLAENSGESISTYAGEMIKSGLDMTLIMDRINEINGNLETVFTGLEILGARFDELVKMMAVRLPAPTNLTNEQKTAATYQASHMAAVLSKNATDAALSYHLGDSTIDPLGISRFFSSYKEQKAKREQEQAAAQEGGSSESAGNDAEEGF